MEIDKSKVKELKKELRKRLKEQFGDSHLSSQVVDNQNYPKND